MNASTSTPELPSTLLDQVADHIFATRCISRHDQQCFMQAALAKTALSPDERIMVDRVFELLRRGLLHVTD